MGTSLSSETAEGTAFFVLSETVFLSKSSVFV